MLAWALRRGFSGLPSCATSNGFLNTPPACSCLEQQALKPGYALLAVWTSPLAPTVIIGMQALAAARGGPILQPVSLSHMDALRGALFWRCNWLSLETLFALEIQIFCRGGLRGMRILSVNVHVDSFQACGMPSEIPSQSLDCPTLDDASVCPD